MGIRTISITDHDTRAGEAQARATAEALGMEFVSGVEITCVHEGTEMHVLAYGLPRIAPLVDTVLEHHRGQRVEELREIAHRLKILGAPINVEALLSSAASRSGTCGRAQIAEYLVGAGHARSSAEAVEKFLARDAPAYVPHDHITATDIIDRVAESGGLASLAHPGRLNRDDFIPRLVDAGLRGLEVHTSGHDFERQRHYRDVARRFNLIETGGSNFHGDGTPRAELFGVVGMSAGELDRLRVLISAAHGADADLPLTHGNTVLAP